MESLFIAYYISLMNIVFGSLCHVTWNVWTKQLSMRNVNECLISNLNFDDTIV